MFPSNQKPLSASRAADRRKMAAEIISLSSRFDASALIEKDLSDSQCIVVTILTKEGMRTTVDLDSNAHCPDQYLVCCNIDIDCNSQFSDDFGGSVNVFHRRKVTLIANGFEDLKEKISFALQRSKDGTAYKVSNTSHFFTASVRCIGKTVTEVEENLLDLIGYAIIAQDERSIRMRYRNGHCCRIKDIIEDVGSVDSPTMYHAEVDFLSEANSPNQAETNLQKMFNCNFRRGSVPEELTLDSLSLRPIGVTY